MKLPKIIEGDFEPHFSVKHMLKDLRLAEKIARTLDLDLAMNEAVRNALIEEVKRGRADDDYSSIARRYLPEGVPLDMQSEPSCNLISSPIFPQATILCRRKCR